MSDVANRDRTEAALARELAKISAPALRKLLAALGQPPSLNNVPDSFWANYSADLRAVLETTLQDIYTAQVHTMATEHDITASVNWNLVNKDAADWARAYSYELVKGITDTTTTALQDIISKAIEQAQPLSEIQANIEPLFGADRAATIATTELTRAASESEASVVSQMAEQGVVMRAIWLSRNDEITCPICGDDGLNGIVADADNQFQSRDGDTYDLPPAHPNCLPGDSLVTPIGGIVATSDRQYDGDVIVIRTASKKQLTITPNHAILTNRGWVSAGLLDVGSHVISRCVSNDPSLCNPDNQNMPTRIQNIAESFGDNRGMVSVPVPATSIDFHGDGEGSDIAVIKTDDFLRDKVKGVSAQHVDKEDFVLRLVGAGTFNILSMFDLSFNRADFAASANMGVSSLVHPLSVSHARPFDKFSLRLTPNVNLVLDETTADYATANTQFISDGLFRTPTDVFLDDVISIERLPFVGHVYNLQTESNIYIANEIITHNCRCSLGWEFAP